MITIIYELNILSINKDAYKSIPHIVGLALTLIAAWILCPISAK